MTADQGCKGCRFLLVCHHSFSSLIIWKWWGNLRRRKRENGHEGPFIEERKRFRGGLTVITPGMKRNTNFPLHEDWVFPIWVFVEGPLTLVWSACTFKRSFPFCDMLMERLTALLFKDVMSSSGSWNSKGLAGYLLINLYGSFPRRKFLSWTLLLELFGCCH